MTTAHIFVGTSLDGYIARADGSIDWLIGSPSAKEDYGYDRFIATIDGIAMGRKTYESVIGLGDWSYPRPVLVVSRTMTDADLRADLTGRVEVTSLTPQGILEEAERRGWKRIYVDGGKLIQSFLREGLITDMTLSALPILIGSGTPLFGPLNGDMAFKHTGTDTFPSGMVQSRYTRAAA
jgi:dihydrofolate reductase